MADVFEEEPEQTVSIKEYLDEVEEQELEADLVLGGDEGKECTYTKGYMKRQAIFSCLTCNPEGNAGICTACSLSCHDGHEILELWTKRNFRCDCGNSKFGGFFCKLFPNKDVENTENSYNQNFKGSYCTCNRPYPDPDVEEQVEMIQCCICEDWFHEEHLGLASADEIPRDEEGEPVYEDLICGGCSVVFSFLTLYPDSIWAAVKKHDATTEKIIKEKNVLENVSTVTNTTSETMPPSGNGSIVGENSEKVNGPTLGENSEKAKGLILGENSEKANGVIPGESSNSGENSEKTKGLILGESSNGKCVVGIDLRVDSPVMEKKKPMFLSKSWREILCRCEKCVGFYTEKKIGYLLEKEDSIAEYEKMAKQKREEKLQQQEGMELNFLDKFGHVEKMEILSGIADMKNEIHSFLESFDTSKPITSADVHQVFENLAKKRRRLE